MNEDLILNVSEGKLQGKACETYKGQRYYSFQGIPYAKPPLGNLRFKPPQPPEKWHGVRDATEEGPECYSKNLVTNIVGGSEDCLFLNVYTPKIKSKELLPVMFWIHGGGFVRGSGGTDLFGPDYLVEKDVVLVTINYRLGALGFLAFSNPSLGVTGNAGLKDAVMALKWVQRNIRQFSGNPKNVTIFGESAGGSAVHFLILSPVAKGLFHKAIIQSGSALNSFSRGKCSYTYELAQQLGIDSNDDRFILNELQKIPVEDLLKASQKIWDPFLISNMRPFCPVIEPKSAKGALITEEPLKIIQSGRYNKVPIIFGYNTLEGIFIYVYMKSKPQHFLINRSLVPHTMNLRIGSVEYEKVAEKIRRMYEITGKESIKDENDLEKAVKVYTHNFFMIDVCRSAILHSENNNYPVFLYRFNLDTELNFMKRIAGINIKGAAHADDLPYVFTNILNTPPAVDSTEFNLIQKVTKLWTNFSKHGRPTLRKDAQMNIEWKPITNNVMNCLAMENEEFKFVLNPDNEFIDFWRKLYNENEIILSKL